MYNYIPRFYVGVFIDYQSMPNTLAVLLLVKEGLRNHEISVKIPSYEHIAISTTYLTNHLVFFLFL